MTDMPEYVHLMRCGGALWFADPSKSDARKYVPAPVWIPLPAEVDTAKAPFDGKRYLIWIDWDDDGDDNAHVAEFDGLHWTPVDNCWVNPAIVTHYQIVEGPT